MENKKLISMTIDYIESHLKDQLNLDKIAKKAGYSKFHLNRVFMQCVGCTIYKYIQFRRLTIAAEQLVGSEKPILEIAHDANYSSQQSFTFAFSKVYGFPPQEYRMNNVYTPKCNKFKIESKLVFAYRTNMEYGGLAA